MRFFVPDIADSDQAWVFHQGLARSCSKRFGIPVTPARLFALRYRSGGREYLAQVGIPHPPGSGAKDVVAIFPTPQEYFICTRGDAEAAFQWTPVSKDSISDVEYFNEVDDEILQPERDPP